MKCSKLFKSAYDCSLCKNKECVLRLKTDEQTFRIVSDYDFVPCNATGTVIDIGTTTIAALRFENGEIKGKYTALNRQKYFGADVISRINASNNGNKSQLQKLLRQQINECLLKLNSGDESIIICANTPITSFFMGYDCRGLGVYPFKAQSIETVYEDKYTVLGGISGFVGGDITAGLYMCGFDENERINMFIDIGTNGEIAIGNKEKILCTSVAAGPAFEGGNISCGSGAVKGAITSVSISDGVLKTIDNAKPASLCGSGIIELVAEMLRNGIIDSTGCLNGAYNGKYYLTEDVSITAQDIRNIQTAKSALCTGIETIIAKYGINERDIDNIFISGGFSKHLDLDKACEIGLLPIRLRKKYKCVGNSSLGGGVKVLEKGTEGIEKIRAVSAEFSLAESENFNELFMKYMYFN